MRRVRLLDKPGERESASAAFDRLPACDVAIAALGPLRINAEGDEHARASGNFGALDRSAEGIGVGDRVIRRHHQHQRIGLAFGDAQRGNARRRRRVAADRLEQQGFRSRGDLAQLLGDDEAVLLIGNDQRRGEAGLAGDPQHRLLQQAGIAEERQQLLRIKRARHWPEAGARAPGQDHRMDHAFHYHNRVNQALPTKRFPSPRATGRASAAPAGRRS